MTDPFENDPFEDEGVDMTPQEHSRGGSVWDVEEEDSTDKKEKITINNNSEGKVVVTMKGDGGFDAPWIVIHADDVEEAKSLIKQSVNDGLVGDTATGARHFQKAWLGDGKQSTSGQRRPQNNNSRPGKPANATKPPNGESAPECKHGEMQFKSGTKDKGGELIEWKAWMCPAPRGASDQCKPQWIND